jgi:hypothetical protein
VEVISGCDVKVWRKKVGGWDDDDEKDSTKCIMGVQIDTVDNIDSNFLLYSFFFFFICINPFPYLLVFTQFLV